jgi:uncharacterized protein DUF3141
LDAFRDMRDRFGEQLFLAVYGSPALQAACGIDANDTAPLRKAPNSPIVRELIEKRAAELKARIGEGGLREALVRAMLYMALERGGPDERTFEAIRRLRGKFAEGSPLSVAQFKNLVREQYFMLLLQPEAALAAIPTLLSECRGDRRHELELLRKVLTARAELSPSEQERFQTISRLFEAESGGAAQAKLLPIASQKKPAA